MIEETGEVLSSEGEYAWVETQRKTACGSCSVNKGCGTSALSKMYGNKFSRVKALNPIAAKSGETVVLGLAEEALVRGSLMMYGVPLLGLIFGGTAGAALANMWGLANTDALSALFGILGLVAGFYVVHLFNRRVARSEQYQPVILRHCDHSPSSAVVHIDHR